MSISHFVTVSPRKHQRFIHPAVYKAVLATGLALALSGCGAIETTLGTRVNLAKIPVVSMQVTQDKKPGITPGGKTSLIATLTQPDGKTLTTEGAGHGKVMWKDLKVTPTIVKTNNKGSISLSKDPRVSDGKVPHVTVTVPSHPDVHAADLDIPVRYDGAFTAHFSGASGSDGLSGSNGIDGSSGMPGSTDPDNPSPGGNGSDGTDGTDGRDGGDGSDGPPVQIMANLKPGNHPLLQVVVTVQNKQKFFMVDPQGGSLIVSTEGGSGGSGGKGGRGGRGGSGGIGSPSGSSGRDGSNGRDGSSGSSGRGGSIQVTYDPTASPYLSTIHLSNDGGPRPVFVQQTLPPLW